MRSARAPASAAWVRSIGRAKPASAATARARPDPHCGSAGIAAQIAEAHEQSIIHCDLKPANIKMRDDGTVKVLDFGPAKALAATPAQPSTRRSRRCGQSMLEDVDAHRLRGHCRVVELRFFAGLNIAEAAEALAIYPYGRTRMDVGKGVAVPAVIGEPVVVQARSRK